MENKSIDDNYIIDQTLKSNQEMQDPSIKENNIINDINNNNINDDNIRNNNMNNNNDDIVNNNNRINNNSNKKIVIIISLVVLYISFYDLYQIFQNINIIKKAYLSFPSRTFEECYFYPHLFNSFIQILTYLLGMDLILLFRLSVGIRFKELNVVI